MPRSRSGFSRGQGQRRKTAWGFGPGSSTPTNFSSSSTVFLGTAIVPSVEGLTIARIRGQLNAILRSAATIGDGFQGAFGIGIATETAVLAGVTALPTPITDMDAENWLFWKPFSIHATRIAAIGESFELEVDTKAMRKFPSEMALYGMVELVEVGAANIDVFFDSRTLFFLP